MKNKKGSGWYFFAFLILILGVNVILAGCQKPKKNEIASKREHKIKTPLPHNTSTVGRKNTLSQDTVRILNRFDFDNEKWKLFVEEKDCYTCTDTNRQIYYFTNNREILKHFQDKWKSPEVRKFEYFPYCIEYQLHFVRNGPGSKNEVIDLDLCHIYLNSFQNLVTLSVYFPPELRRDLFSNLKNIPKTDYIVNDGKFARKLYWYLSAMDSVWVDDDGFDMQPWLKFDGFMTLIIPDTLSKGENYYDSLIKATIKKENPTEKFEKMNMGSRYEETNLFNIATGKHIMQDNYMSMVFCSKKLAGKFECFGLDKKWRPFQNITLHIYGLTKIQVEEFVRKLKKEEIKLSNKAWLEADIFSISGTMIKRWVFMIICFIFYFILCFVTGIAGIKRKTGYWYTVFFAVVLTPVFGAFVALTSQPGKRQSGN